MEKGSEEKWKKAKILETNLIKGELASFFNWKKGILVLIFYFLFSGLIVAGFYGGLLLWEKQRESLKLEYSGKILDLEEQVIKPLEEEAKKILTVKEKIKLAKSLLDRHIYWTNFFKFLEDNTLTDVYYTSSFAGDTNGEYSFSARTRNFKMILDQVNIMRGNDNVEKVIVSGGSVKSSGSIEQGGGDGQSDVGGVDFKLELTINPNIFMK